jgi:hypothetical protein
MPHGHGWMIFMDENMDETKCMNFILNVGNKCNFCRKKMVETIHVGSFKNNLTHEMFLSHTSKSYFIFP